MTTQIAKWERVSALFGALTLGHPRRARWISKSAVARTYIRLSALSVVAAMALAATYAIGDWLKQDWLLIPRMAKYAWIVEWIRVLASRDFRLAG